MWLSVKVSDSSTICLLFKIVCLINGSFLFRYFKKLLITTSFAFCAHHNAPSKVIFAASLFLSKEEKGIPKLVPSYASSPPSFWSAL